MSVRLSFLKPDTQHKGMSIDEIDISVIKAPFKSAFITIEPGCSSPLDIHSVCETWVVLSGSGELIYDGHESLAVNVDDVFYFASHKSHKVKNIGDGPLKLISMWWPAS